MTSASADSDLLMLIVSFNLSLFSPAPEVANLSLPAKSTAECEPYTPLCSFNVPRFSIASHFSSVRGLNPLTLRVKTEWERDDRSFISVAATARRLRALSSNVDTCLALLSGTAF